MSSPRSRLPVVPWPPIINDAALPWQVAWHDRLLTITAWLIAAFTVWLTLWSLMTRRRVRTYHQAPVPEPLNLTDEAAHAACTEANLLAWRELRISIVHLDEASRPRVESCQRNP